MSAPQPTAGLDRLVMLVTQPFLRWRHFKTARTTLIPVPGPPTLPNNREVVFVAQSFLRWRHFKTARTTLVPVPGPPTLPNNREIVFLTQPFLWWRHLLGSVAVCASRSAVARAPTAGLDWPAVNLAKPFLERR